ncbi:LamG domain-containing protein [Chryseobacterium aahli]|uniref:LamG domain-containing protein n=1 Tax=Chryseobacterium aahli TaxID=1278643 RepID=UPI001F6180F8|nr:LamG domain-containing protein [Chryseobacterium aahli]MCI3938811.1 LamG domain-containing protein [Chryseobacterium aahli]
MKNQKLILFLLLFLGNVILYAQCNVNAGGNQTICGTTYTLQGTSSGSTSGTPTWSIVSKPSGAPDPVFSNANSLTPTVTGMTSPGNYVFQIAQNCSPSGSATSQVTITAPGANTGFTAGPDITNVNATIGSVTLNGVVPTGYTASWSAYNIYSWERSSIKTDQNSQFSSTTSATTTFSLINKANHNIDPAYVVTLRITSTNNPSCYYEDTAIVRFIPNPQIVVRTPYNECIISGGSPSIPFDATSPKFSQGYPPTPGSSGNFGTTITMNVVSQPGGGNIAYQHIFDNNIWFTGVNVVGIYKFTLTVQNSAGTYTTPELTYTFNGTYPNSVSFLTASRPEQMMIYYSTGSGGEVQCNYAGQTTPITVLFALNSSDPVTLTSTVANSGTPPPGGVLGLSAVSGSGTSANRSFTVTPPSGGWRVGTYVLSVATSNGTCSRSQLYYIHISDGNRPNVTVPATTVCYSGSGAVTATIPLPAVYKGVVNTSYFQDFDGRYRLTLVSKPVGAADPVFEPYNNTLFTNTNTTISNLNMQGEYVFKIKADSYNPSVGAFLDREYACSGTSLESNFSVFVSAQVGANAGSAQTIIGATQTTLNGNNPGTSTGAWTLVSKPALATDPVISTPTAYNTNVTGLNSAGTYTFRWTVTTGTCISTSDVAVNVLAITAGGVAGADFWVKSDDAGDIATAWKDHSANANNIPNVGGITLSPADRAHNFHPYTTGYTGSKFFYNNASVMNPTNGELPNTSTSIFSAVRPTTANGTGRITGIDDDATLAAEPGISIANGKPRQYEFFNTTTSTDFSTTFNNGTSNIFSAIANNAVANGGTSASAGGEKRLGLNGSYETTAFTGSNKFQIYGRNLRVGQAGWDAAGEFPGDIMEVLWFKRVLTSNEQSRINSYLAVKNGVTLNENYLSTASAVVWDRTNNAGYNNNVFGIARDNLTALHQKQSGSTNTGQKLVISTTGFADSNAANTTTLTEGQFLMTGDNGLKQSLITPLAYTAGSNGATNFRFESIWKVQNVNTVGTVTVAWPKSVKNLYLVQSLDAAFDGTDTFTPMTIETTVNGVVYNTANVTLGNGQFFTFAGFAQAPGGVTGPDFWVKSDDAGTIGTAWKDNSPNADNIPNVGGITLSPADRNHNFYPYTSGYTGSKFFYNSASVMNPLGNVELPNTNTSVFSAVRPTTANATGRIVGIDDDTTYAAEPAFSIANGRPRQYEFFATTTSSDFSSNFNVGQSNIFSALANNTVANGGTSAIAGGEKRLGLNGTYESFSGFAAANRFQIYGKNLRIGEAGWDAGAPFPGDIMEVAWYNRTLTANEQSRVNSYLAVKNGVTLNENYLSTNSSVVWDRTINTGYNNNIFGIAKDDFTALHQKQAGSVNSGQQLVISTTGFADSNAANNTGLANDLQYLTTGDNGLKQNLTIPLAYTSGSNGITNYRFESIWKVQNTNNVGTVTVAWPKSVKNLYLVQSPDATFDGTDTFTPMATETTVNGVIYNTANVTLANGQFFTFAGFGNAPGGVATNLSYWYRADKNATNTGATTDVTGWTDMWNGTTVAQRVTNALPKYAVGTSSYFNFNPGINFTAINQTLGNITTQTVTNTSNDIFTVTKEGMTAPGSPTPHFLSIGMDNVNTTISNWDYMGFTPASTNIERRVVGGGTQFVNSAVNFSTAIPSIMYNTFTNTTVARGLNGAANGSTANYTAVGLALGGHIFGDTRWTGNSSDNGGFIGNIGETIIYGAGNLTATERRRVDSYLAIKYGITLGQVNTQHYLNTDGNIVWNGASNTTFNNNIFGVSRDDIEVFEQKVSTSVNAGTILTVATMNDFVNPNNAVARTSFVNDKTYFLLGDNNITATTFTSMTINGYTGASRIARIWLAQRTNTSGTMYFGADLSSYGGGFGSGDHVKMIIADDAAFTTNVAYVDGTYDVATGKWVHSYNFDSGNANRYITYATVNEVACTTGCNDNTYLNAVDPNTIEYDNILADETTTIVKQKDGSYYVWGPTTSPNVSSTNANVVLNLLAPTKIDPSTTLPAAGSSGTGFSYTGTPLKAAIANVMHLLTTDGLYVWGNGNMYTLSSMGNTTITYRTPNGYKFGKLTVNNKADGLPPGVSPSNVKMMSGNQETLSIVTCSGATWILSQSPVGSVYGDGMTGNVANNSIWHRVMTSATQTLDNVVAVRGIRSTKFALTSNGKLYTWGLNTFHNDNTAAATSNYATEISVPAGVTPKMIGMTEGNTEGEGSYYLLATNGKLYAMGYNAQRQLGLGDATIRLNWTEVTATSGSNTLGGNTAWISPAENVNNLPSINVLTTDGKQWGWGRSSQGHLGVVNNTGIDPTFMPGNGTGANELGLSDKVIALKDAGQHAINFKENSTKFGFIGLNTFGSKGDGTSVTGTQNLKYTYISDLDLCGAIVAGVCYKPGIIAGTPLDTKVGITALNRAGSTNADNWPMTRKGGWLALEAKTKGFVPNRVAFSGGNPVGIAPANFVEGMMVYDTTNKCMKMYTSTDGGTNYAWSCISTQTCPD